jgi:prepilin-type N-terminal cleavage/methylation domain-containing protein
MEDDHVVDGRRRGANEHGFTLIELLIVMIVLGTLAGIVIFTAGGVTDDAADAACVAEVRTLAGANALYRVRHKADAPTIDDLVDGGFLEKAPSYVTFADGTTDPPTMADCESTPLTSTTSSSS